MEEIRVSTLFNVITIVVDTSNIVLNFFLVYALKKLKKLKVVSYMLIFWLSVSDLLVGTTGILFHTAIIFKTAYSTREVMEYVMGLFLTFSGCLTVTIAVDRCIHMKLLNRYSLFMTRRKGIAVLVVNAVFTVGILCLYRFSPLLSLSINISGFPVIFIAYVWAYITVRKGAMKETSESISKTKGVEWGQDISTRRNTAHLEGSESKTKNDFDSRPFIISVKISRTEQDGVTALQQQETPNKSSANASGSVQNEDRLKTISSQNSKPMKRKRPEKEFGKAVLCILVSFSFLYIPSNIAQLIYSKSQGNSFDISLMYYYGLFPLCYSSLNVIIFLSFSSELKAYVKELACRATRNLVSILP